MVLWYLNQDSSPTATHKKNPSWTRSTMSRPWWRLHGMTLFVGGFVLWCGVLENHRPSAAPIVWREFNWPIPRNELNWGWPFVYQVGREVVPRNAYINAVVLSVILTGTLVCMESRYRHPVRSVFVRVSWRDLGLIALASISCCLILFGTFDRTFTYLAYHYEFPIPRLLRGYVSWREYPIFAGISLGIACLLQVGGSLMWRWGRPLLTSLTPQAKSG